MPREKLIETAYILGSLALNMLFLQDCFGYKLVHGRDLYICQNICKCGKKWNLKKEIMVSFVVFAMNICCKFIIFIFKIAHCKCKSTKSIYCYYFLCINFIALCSFLVLLQYIIQKCKCTGFIFQIAFTTYVNLLTWSVYSPFIIYLI